MRVVTSKQMKQIEVASLQYDLTFQRLMENAGSAAAAFIRRTFQVQGLNCMVFCGAGNNGGDGLVVARKLFEQGANVVSVLTHGTPRSEEALAMLSMAQLMEIPILDLEMDREKIRGFVAQADIIVDGIYGTGFRDSLDDAARTACTAINDAIAAVIALDIPSGVTCDKVSADVDAIRADFTVAFDSCKPVHILPAGKEYCGRVETVEIGIPDEAREGLAAEFSVLDTGTVFSHLPPRSPHAHKGTHGRLLSICGCGRYRGAAVLSSLGALHSGLGLLTLASTEPVCAAVTNSLYEATCLPLPENPMGTLDADAAIASLDLSRYNAILIGCGLGHNRHTAKLLRHVLANAACPVIVDADGINALAGNIMVLKEANAPVILTPHPGEMARLCGVPVDQIESDRSAAALQLSEAHGVVVALKGHETVIAAPDGSLYLNTTGNPGLAKGGSGDILAGIIASFAAQGVEPGWAAACGVHLHGLAADKTAARRSQYAMLPSELLDDLAEIFLQNGR